MYTCVYVFRLNPTLTLKYRPRMHVCTCSRKKTFRFYNSCTFVHVRCLQKHARADEQCEVLHRLHLHVEIAWLRLRPAVYMYMCTNAIHQETYYANCLIHAQPRTVAPDDGTIYFPTTAPTTLLIRRHLRTLMAGRFPPERCPRPEFGLCRSRWRCTSS